MDEGSLGVNLGWYFEMKAFSVFLFDIFSSVFYDAFPLFDHADAIWQYFGLVQVMGC